MKYSKWSMRCTVQYMDPTPPVNIDEIKQVEYDVYFTIYGSYSTFWHWWITSSGVWYVLYNTWILLHLLILMNYIKWSMICTVQYMDLTPLDLTHIDWWITTSGVWYVLYNTWILLHLLTLMNYYKWSMICTVQYMDLTPLVNIDELQQLEYDMYCTIHGSYSTC